jgi:lysyl-tRNA synthetase class 2
MEPFLRQDVIRHARFTEAIRAFFQSRGYAEVDTPSLSPHLIPEPAIEVFRTDYLPARGSPRPMWLIPSPELWMKRLVARGAGDIYQISRSFRNCDFGGPHHNPEFRLLEWYTVGSGYLESIGVAEDLFSFVLDRTAPGRPAAALRPPFLRISMEEAFQRHARIDLARCQDAGTLRDEGRARGIAMPDSPTWEEAFHIVFLTMVEPNLPREKPLVLFDYPALVPTTAQRRQGTPWAERWELYVDGIEIANCYTEETDAAALRVFVKEEAERRHACRTEHAIDPDFAELFPAGFPPLSGAALGVDRLEMVFSGESTLQGVILFPFSDILRGHSTTDA